MRRSNLFRSMRSIALLASGLLVTNACRGGDSIGPDPELPKGVVTMQAVLPPFVRGLVLRVTGPGIDSTLVFNFLPDSAGIARGTLSVPIGPRRRFAAEGVDSLGSVTHRGETTTGILAGSNPPLALTLNPLVGTVPVTITVGPLSLNITAGPTLAVRGDSTTFAATAIGPDGVTVPNSEIVFASSNPAILDVRPSGRGRATLVGTVDIVATWRGLASTRRVTIDSVAALTGEILVLSENVTPATQTAELVTPLGIGRLLFSESNMASATVSPDLQTVVFQRSFENQILRRVSPFTSTITLRSDGTNYGMQISRDGTRLVWFREPGLSGAATREIFIADADGSNAAALTSDGVADEFPDLSPSGSTVIWSRHSATGMKIFRMTSTGASQIQLTPSSSESERAPRYSPDGSRIAFLSTGSGTVRLVVMNADGSGRTIVPVATSVAVFSGTVEWAPSGRALAFGGTEGNGVRGVYLANLDGSGLRRLRANTVPESALDWR